MLTFYLSRSLLRHTNADLFLLLPSLFLTLSPLPPPSTRFLLPFQSFFCIPLRLSHLITPTVFHESHTRPSGSYLLSLSSTFYVSLVLSLICSRFVFLSLSIIYRTTTYYSLTNSDSLKFSLSVFHSPFRNPLALSFSPYLCRIFRLRLARSYVRTFVTHTVSFALYLFSSLILLFSPPFPSLLIRRCLCPAIVYLPFLSFPRLRGARDPLPRII